MKNTMVGMLPSGTYVLARLDGTPYSQGEYEMLLRDFDILQESRAFWEREHTREREQRQKEIGAQEFRGNTVSYIYDKEKSYGAHFDRMRGEIAALTADLEEARATVASQAKRLEATTDALLFIRDECDWEEGGDHFVKGGDRRIGPACTKALEFKPE